MQEVDYTQFLYKRKNESKKTKPQKKSSKLKKCKTILLYVVVIFLCFAILFLCVDFFGKGILWESISAFANKEEYVYYLIVSPNKTRDTAYAQSLIAKNSGGAGYVVLEDNRYLVVYSIFIEKQDADSVRNKNLSLNFIVYPLKYSPSNSNFGSIINNLIIEISECCNKLEQGKLTESELNSYLDAYILKFSAVENLSDSDKLLAEFAVRSLESIDAGITQRTELLFQLRHCLCSILFSANPINVD